jgi:hypothetical protein
VIVVARRCAKTPHLIGSISGRIVRGANWGASSFHASDADSASSDT